MFSIFKQCILNRGNGEMNVNTILRKSTHTTTIILLSSSEGTIVLSREVQWLNQRRGLYT
jgi:hypothetical protein